jgi:hypothetical protein
LQLRQLTTLLALTATAIALVGCGELERGDCANFRACAEEYRNQFGTESVDLARYDEDGDCWQDPLVAEACIAQCRDTMTGYDQVLTDADLDTEICNVIDD